MAGEELSEYPARARHRGEPVSEQPPTRARAYAARAGRGLWVVALLLVVAALGADRVLGPVPWLRQAPAAALAVLLAIGLAARAGGSPLAPAVVAAAVGAAAVATQWAPLLAGAAMGTAVLAACLAVLGTTAATRFPRVAAEVLLAELVAGAGALGVAGFDVDLDGTRLDYTVLAVSMLALIALVYRLGGGLHGLGRTGVVLGLGALVLLAFSLAYAAALARYGASDLVASVDDTHAWVADHLGAAPHMIELLVGVPALTWGVSLRARRRQGWWVCVFGAAATASVATRLASPDAPLGTNALSAAYGLVVGLLIGWVLIRIELALAATRGRRTRRSAGDLAGRVEPSRLHALQ